MIRFKKLFDRQNVSLSNQTHHITNVLNLNLNSLIFSCSTSYINIYLKIMWFALCRRLFSILKFIKTRWQNLLQQEKSNPHSYAYGFQQIKYLVTTVHDVTEQLNSVNKLHHRELSCSYYVFNVRKKKLLK